MAHRDWMVGDVIIASPVGSGELTGETEVGYPMVNDIAVTWMIRDDGRLCNKTSYITPEMYKEIWDKHINECTLSEAVAAEGSNVVVGPWGNKKGQ